MKWFQKLLKENIRDYNYELGILEYDYTTLEELLGINYTSSYAGLVTRLRIDILNLKITFTESLIWSKK